MNKFSKEWILDNAQKENVKHIRLQFTDLFGQLKNVEIPASQLKKALNNEMMFDGSSIEGFTRIEESDMYLRPDLHTWMVYPWDLKDNARVARLVCNIYNPNGKPFTGDPRYILQKTIEDAKKAGFNLAFVGPEPEFFLFKKDKDGNVTKELNDSAGYFDLAPVDLGENCRRDIVLTLEKMGFEVEASHHEVAQGQHEVDFKYQDILSTADAIQTFKDAVKNVAEEHNLFANFMAKPIFGINGSGMHCNISLFTDENTNAFYDENADLQLSDTARSFLAGVMKYARQLAILTNPTINSYKRLVPGYEAPVNIAWSPSNRSCMIRIPSSRGLGTRVEVRNPDPSANPYLALAGILKAGLLGIEEGLEAGQPEFKNLYHMSAEEKEELGIKSLPGSLEEALNEFKSSSFGKDLLGDHAYTHYIKGKELEHDEYRLQVFDWELERYQNI